MKSINFTTCQLTEYAINGDESNPIRINLRDVNLRKRMDAASAQLEELEQKYAEIRTPEDAIAADTEIRRVLNAVFDTDVCTPAFGDTNCLTEVDDLPLFAHFFRSFGAVIAEDIKALAPEKPSRVDEYVAPVVTRTQPLAPLANPYGTPDVNDLTPEQKADLLKQLLS